MCESNHSELEIRQCLLAAVTTRSAEENEAVFASRCSAADKTFCDSLSTASLAPDQARDAANDLADTLRDYGTALVSGEATDSLALNDFFAHLMATPFTRAIVHYEEIGLSEDQLFRLIDLVKEHRSFALKNDRSTAVREICGVAPGELATADQVHAASEAYREVLMRTVNTVEAVFEMLSEPQKAKLREIYERETGHTS